MLYEKVVKLNLPLLKVDKASLRVFWYVGPLICGIVLGFCFLFYPSFAAILISVIALCAFGIWHVARLPQVFVVMLGVGLLCYAFLGRGFSHLGVAPFYPGELILATGLLATVVKGRLGMIPFSFLDYLLVSFALWGAICTVPYVNNYGLDALRDGVVWGYLAFAILVASFLSRDAWFIRALDYFRLMLPFLVVWIPGTLVMYKLNWDTGLLIPGTSIPIIGMKPAIAAVHLAGMAAFVLLGLHKRRLVGINDRIDVKELVWWFVWLVGFLVLLSLSRGGALAVFLSLCTIFICMPSWRWIKVGLLGIFVCAIFLALNIEIDLGGDRKISPQQYMANIVSIFSDVENETGGLETTKEWRLNWWKDIIGYTFGGDYFWFGKGYGVNLANDDAYQVLGNESLRSPHNIHMTILARSGVPGLLLWVLIQIVFAFKMIRAYYRSRRAGQESWSRVNLWIFSYWLAFIIAGTFDVFLEGPHGGIWFWSLLGFGLAAVKIQQKDILRSGVRSVSHR